MYYKNKMLSALLVVILWVLYGCTHENVNPTELRGVCFEAEILPIFQTNCALSGCHDAQSHEEGYILTDYQHIIAKEGVKPGNAKDSKIYESITGNGEESMPPDAPLTDRQVTLIRVWIDQGAENSTNCSN